ncbi:class I SAM-dependent methyltransferase [Candidatus Tisiphia endosymbiont of Stenodema calcarata]|uniref:class I SAM-dependent methyltransferase n=1 Tax=Candidatus Tisiphia endosymbiont of Stenodema calcarata TaxID=3139337 RepID=UPI003CCAB8A9
MGKKNSYILAIGNETDYRLSILNKIYGKYTNILLDRLELRPSMKVAIIGCGSGESIDVIYQKIGQDGKLLCLDISQKQIELTKSKLSSKNIDIVEYQVADIQDYQGNEQYDLVYCRFVLIHLTHPQKALNNMLSLLKLGGTIACEEHDYKAIFNYPYARSIEQYKELLHKIEKRLSVDYSYGIKLFNTLCSLQLTDVKFDFHQPVFNGAEEKLLLKLSLLEEKEHFIKHKLIDNLEIEKMLKEMDQIIQDKTVIQSAGGVFQSWGRKLQ